MWFQLKNSARRVFDRVWNPVRRLPSLQDHLSDISDIHFEQPGDLDAFIQILSGELSVEIEIFTNGANAESDLETGFGVSMAVAEMLYDSVSGKAIVFVPTHIREDHFLFFKSVLHELSHLISGHPIPIVNSSGQFWWPPKRLAGNVPGTDLYFNEREADLRAEWSLMIALGGWDIQDSENQETTF